LRLAVSTVLPALAWGCGLFSPPLSREAVERLVEADRRFTEVERLQMVPAEEALSHGRAEGLWWFPPAEATAEERLWLSARATKEIEGLEGTPEGALTMRPVRRPRRRVVAVTGLRTIDDSTREAEFAWRLEGLTPLVARYAGLDESTVYRDGEAVLRLYDDGWRLDRVTAELAPGPLRPDRAAEAQAASRALGEARAGLAGRWGATTTEPFTGYRRTLELRDDGTALSGAYVSGRGSCGRCDLALVRNDPFVFRFRPSVSGDGCDASAALLRGQELVAWVDETGALAVQWEPGLLWEKEPRQFRRLTAQEEDAERAKVETEARWQQARTRTRTIATHHVEHFTEGARTWLGKENNTYSYDVEITDADVRVAEELRSKLTGRRSGEKSFGWWQLVALKTTPGRPGEIEATVRSPQSYPLLLETYFVKIQGDDHTALLALSRALDDGWRDWKARFPEFVHVAQAVQ
jgi:hypothetical protein